MQWHLLPLHKHTQGCFVRKSHYTGYCAAWQRSALAAHLQSCLRLDSKNKVITCLKHSFLSSLVICRRQRKSKMTLKISVYEDWLYQGSENMITSKFWTMWLFSGRLFGATGEQPFIGSTLSSAFPLVNHPAFGAIYSAGASRPEFGGLGSLGMSAALAAHPQLGALSGKTEICCFASSWFPLSSPRRLFSSILRRMVASCWSPWTRCCCLSPLLHWLPSLLPSYSA